MHRHSKHTAAALVSLALLVGCGSMWSDARAPVKRTERMTEYIGVSGLESARIAVVAASDEASDARDTVARTLSGAGLTVVEGEDPDLTIRVTVEILGDDQDAARVLISCPEADSHAARLVGAAHVDTDGLGDPRALIVQEAGLLASDLVAAVRGE